MSGWRRVATGVFILCITASVSAEDKPLATQAAEALQPLGKGINTAVTQFLAGTGGLVGKSARQNLDAQVKADAIANRGTRQTMQACLKPGNLIDDDVRECMNGTRARDW